MSGWQILGKHLAPLPANWREALCVRLGSRPRRLGNWCEIALAGALEALAEAGETRLPASAQLSLSSLDGPGQATRGALEQARGDGLPLPLAFLQSQPALFLAHFSALTGWQGDARLLAARDPLAALRLACHTATGNDLLLGWVAEKGLRSQWLRLRRSTHGGAARALPARLEALAGADWQLIRP